MWDKVKSWCWNSLTVAWAYIMAAVGAVLEFVDSMASVVVDHDVSAKIQTIIGGDPKIIGRYMVAVAVITLIARLRSIVRS